MAEYYQQQTEMLEGFNEMDALAERGFLHKMSLVHKIIFIAKCLNLFICLFLSVDLKPKWFCFYGFRKSGKIWLEVKRLLLGYPILQT